MTIQFKAYEIKEARTNVPSPTQLRIEPNPSYVDSLIAGVVSPIVHLPQIIWFGSLWPFVQSIFKSLTFIGVSMVAGVTGKANGYRVTGMEERTLTDEEKQAALDDMLQGSGYKAVPIKELYGNSDKWASGEH